MGAGNDIDEAAVNGYDDEVVLVDNDKKDERGLDVTSNISMETRESIFACAAKHVYQAKVQNCRVHAINK